MTEPAGGRLRPRRRGLARRRARSRPRPTASPRCAPPGCGWRSCRTTRAHRSATWSPSSTAWGSPATPDDVVTSAMAAAWLLAALARAGRPGARVRRPGGARGARRRAASSAVDDGPADAVVVGFHRDFDYDGLDRASRAVRDGARFVATNLDATYPVPGGLIPGAGSLVAAVATAAGRRARGRGQAGGADGRRSSASASATPGSWSATGRRPTARSPTALGWPFALVLSGVTAAVAPPGGEAIPDPPPPFVGRRPRRALAPDARSQRFATQHLGTRTPAPVTVRRRLDAELVRRGLLGSRRQAVEAIAAGRVRVGGQPGARRRPGWSAADEPIQVTGDPPRFVSRGGEKLAAALDRVRGRRARAGGSSTPARRPAGSPTACCRRGAAHVDRGRRRPGSARVVAARRPAGHRARAHQRPPPRARRPRRPGRPRRRRPLLHLAAHRRARARAAARRPTATSCCW